MTGINKLNTAWFNSDTSEVHSPKGRMVYPTLLEPRGIKGDPNSDKKYSVTLLLPKTADIAALKKLVEETAVEKFGRDWMKKVKRLPLLKTADNERLKEYADEFPTMLRATANVDFPPFLFGPNAKPHTSEEPSEIYSGRWAIVTVRAFGYDTAGNKGVAFGLQRVQLLDHAEAIAGGRVPTASGFDAIESTGGSTDAVFGGDAAATSFADL